MTRGPRARQAGRVALPGAVGRLFGRHSPAGAGRPGSGRRGGGGRGRHGRPEGPARRYGVLLLLLILAYLLSASGLNLLADELQTLLFVAVMLLALRGEGLSRSTVRLGVAAALAGSAAAVGAELTRTQTGSGIADIWRGLILLLTAVLIVRRVLDHPSVTLQSIYGALSAYLIIGLMFAAYYAAIQHLAAGPFFADRQPANTQTFQYFSFTTLTTLGYGDFTAAGNGGRALAVIEALTGQVFLATLVARLVASFRVPSGQARPAARRRWPPGNVRRPRASQRNRPRPGARKTSSRDP